MITILVQRPTCLGTQNPISWDITPRKILNLLSAIIDTREGKCWEQLWGSEPWTGNSPPTFEGECDFFQISPIRWLRKKKWNLFQDGFLNSPGNKRFGLSYSYHHISVPHPRDRSLKEKTLMVIYLVMLGWMLTETLLSFQGEDG